MNIYDRGAEWQSNIALLLSASVVMEYAFINPYRDIVQCRETTTSCFAEGILLWADFGKNNSNHHRLEHPVN
jgi:hypothetical protein